MECYEYMEHIPILFTDEEWQKLSLPCGRAGKTNHTGKSTGNMPESNKEE